MKPYYSNEHNTKEESLAAEFTGRLLILLRTGVLKPGQRLGEAAMARAIQCPSCGSEVPGDAVICRYCGRALRKVAVKKPPKGKRSWLPYLWIVGALLAMAIVAIFIGSESPLVVGSKAIVQHKGAKGAWFAVDDDAFDRMIGFQNSGNFDEVARLAVAGHAFREPNGSQVVVTGTALGSVRVRVTDGVNVGSEGWTQVEFISRP